MVIQDDTMNTGWIIVTNETDFHLKTTVVFPLHFLFYRPGEERNRMKGRVVTSSGSYGKFHFSRVFLLTWTGGVIDDCVTIQMTNCSSYEDVVRAGRRNGAKKMADGNVNFPSEFSFHHLPRRAHAVCQQ